MIGKQISHYRIIEEIGRGGMGIVYKAEDTSLDRTVALKFLPHQIAASAADRERFKVEARAAAALNHPNIATIYSIEEVDDELFIVMEYLEGKSLKEKIEEGPLEIAEVLDIACQVAEGLQEAHSKRVVHRDIKSSNIMVTLKCQAKIMDFGLAKKAGQLKLTRTGTTVGTPYYMSPEQARGEDADQRTDIWSFGIVLYEMTIGQLPFKGEYEQAVLYSIMNLDFEPISGVRSGVPPEMEQIVHKCLEKKREDRYQSSEHLAADLFNLKADVRTGKRHFAKTTAPAKTGPKVRNKIFIATFFSVLAVAIIYLLTRIPFGEMPADENSVALMYLENQTGESAYDQQANLFIPQIYNKLFTGYKEVIKLPSPAVIKQLNDLQKTAQIDYNGAEKIVNKTSINYRVTALIQNSDDGLTYLLETTKGGKREPVWQEMLNRPDSVKTEEFAQMLADWIAATVWIDGHEEKLHREHNFPKKLTTREIFKNQLSHKARATKAYYQGYGYLDAGDLESSIPYFADAVKIDPAYAIAHILYVFLLLDTEQRQQGLTLLEELKENQMNFSTYEKLYFQLYYDFYRRTPDYGTKKVRELIKLEPYPDFWSYYLGMNYFNAGDYQNATIFTKKHIESGLTPGQISVYTVSAICHNILGSWGEALKALKIGLQRNPEDRSLMYSIMGQYLLLGKEKQADSWFARYEIASKLEVSSVIPAYLRYGEHYLTMGDFDEADSYFQKTLALRDITLSQFTATAHSYLLMRKFDEAEEILLRAAQVYPHNAGIYNELSLLYIHKQDYQKAREYAEVALTLEPENNTVYVLTNALLYTSRNETEKAEIEWDHLFQKCKEAIEVSDLRRSNYFELGLYYSLRGEVELAMQQLETAFEGGYRDRNDLLYTPAFDRLRDDPRTKERYAQFIEKVKATYPALHKKSKRNPE